MSGRREVVDTTGKFADLPTSWDAGRAEHDRGGGVGEDHDAVTVDHDHPVGAVVDDAPEVPLDIGQAVAQLPDLLAEVVALVVAP